MTHHTRRQFLRTSALLGAGAFTLPNLRAQKGSPNDEIAIGIVGCGYQGMINMRNFLGIKGVRVVAVCDVDSSFKKVAKAAVNKHYTNTDCRTYDHYKDLLAHPGLDAVCLSVPDHAHASVGIHAANAGLDIFGEKPFTWGLSEGRMLVDAIEKNKRVWQTGSWQHSTGNFTRFKALIQNNTLGKLTRFECGTPRGHAVRKRDHNGAKLGNLDKVDAAIPATLDWPAWCGPLKDLPYSPKLHPFNWRWYNTTGGGQLMDWVGHHVDIALWTLELDGTGPVRVEGSGSTAPNPFFNTYTKYAYQGEFADGRIIEVRSDFSGTKFTGENGWIHTSRKKLSASDPDLLRNLPEDFETRPPNHWQDFINCVRSRKQAASPAEGAHRAASFGQLAIVAMDTQQAVEWDPKTEKVLNNPEQSSHPRLGARIES